MKQTAYGYDNAGNLTTVTLPSGTGVVGTYSYDTADRLTGMSWAKGASTLASASYSGGTEVVSGTTNSTGRLGWGSSGGSSDTVGRGNEAVVHREFSTERRHVPGVDPLASSIDVSFSVDANGRGNVEFSNLLFGNGGSKDLLAFETAATCVTVR